MKLTELLKLALGFLALLLAAVGLVLPVWPTTPFVLVAIGCFSSNPKLRDRVLRIRCFREYYERYTAGTGISRKTTVVSLTFLWVMLVVSMVLVEKLWLTLLLLAIGIAVTAHILWMSQSRATRARRPAKTTDIQERNGQ